MIIHSRETVFNLYFKRWDRDSYSITIPMNIPFLFPLIFLLIFHYIPLFHLYWYFPFILILFCPCLPKRLIPVSTGRCAWHHCGETWDSRRQILNCNHGSNRILHTSLHSLQVVLGRAPQKRHWLVVLTILKNIGQWEGFSHILWKIKAMFETTNQDKNDPHPPAFIFHGHVSCRLS